jgi:hypothetical protein
LAEIRPPNPDGDKVVRKLSSSVADVAVGGGGRYLVLRLTEERKLAIFDVNKAEIVGHIRLAETEARFAAGLEDVVIVLPGAGLIERWSLQTRERDVSATLPVKGIIKSVAMGSASRGPLLLHCAAGSQDLDRAFLALINVRTMRVIVADLNLGQASIMGSSYRNLVHLRASAEGRTFGMWCTSHSPTGCGTVVVSDPVTRVSYGHWSVGHVLPSADGKLICTRSGTYAPFIQMTDMQRQGEATLPAAHGEYYLVLPSPNLGAPPRLAGVPPAAQSPAGAATLPNLTIRTRDKDKLIASVDGVELAFSNEDNIGNDFTFDKRIHLIPDAQLIITIPTDNNRLVLHRYSSDSRKK